MTDVRNAYTKRELEGR